MKQTEEMTKRMPYAESEDYVSRLIERTTETAIRQQGRQKAATRRLRIMAAAACTTALLAVAGINYVAQQQQEPLVAEAQDNGPIDDFLNSISDEEAQLLAYYEMDEIDEISEWE